jgi:nicotinate phosphoribosyltransferase
MGRWRRLAARTRERSLAPPVADSYGSTMTTTHVPPRATGVAVDPALLTDLYQLTMAQAYWREDMLDTAVFSLFVRRLLPGRNFLLACGLDDVLQYLEALRFDDEALAYLARLDGFQPEFLDWLGRLRFTGDVRAVPEGTPLFADEPILEVRAPLPEAQVVETYLMNQVHLQTVLASKGARVVAAADGRRVVDFGLRRIHGSDAGLKAARAFYIAGVDATSNVLAGRVYGVPVVGTMAHSYIQAHEDEAAAFRAFVEVYPEAVLLVDTYDTLAGVRRVVELARALGEGFRVRAIRLDSGDLAKLAVGAREILDAAGLERVEIFATGGLDEDRVAALVRAGAPVDGFGVGTRMGVSADAPSLDMVYKLSEYAGSGRLKLSTGKPILPGEKQVFRVEEDGVAVRDVIARADETVPGRPLLRAVMRSGRRIESAHGTLEGARRLAAEELARLPAPVRGLEPAEPPYRVDVSDALASLQRTVARRVDRAGEEP